MTQRYLLFSSIIISVQLAGTICLIAQENEPYKSEPFEIEGRRWVYPKPLSITVSTASDILNVPIPFLKTSYEYDHYFLFRILMSLPINIEYSNQEYTKEKEYFQRSEEYQLISDSLRQGENNLPKKKISEISYMCLEEWGYQYDLNNISMTIYPQEESLLKKIKVPSFQINDYSYEQIEYNPVILSIFKENGIRFFPKNTGIHGGVATSYNKFKNIKSHEFAFSFSGGTMFDYLVEACEACMVEQPDSFVTFRFEPNKRKFRKSLKSKYDSLRYLEYE